MKFSIGEFSRITSFSIKSLRLYHEKEILIPSEVDEFTGYRYYNKRSSRGMHRGIGDARAVNQKEE